MLLALTNPTVAALGMGNIALYAGAYTYSKRITEMNTWLGSIVGAIPPLMGWIAADGVYLCVCVLVCCVCCVHVFMCAFVSFECSAVFPTATILTNITCFPFSPHPSVSPAPLLFVLTHCVHTSTGLMTAPEPYALGGLLFLWQFPHFFALSYMHREDYARGGFQVRSCVWTDRAAGPVIVCL